MPLRLSVPGVAGVGNLGLATPLADVIAGITGFEALFLAGQNETVAGGELSSWDAYRGTGTLSQSNNTRYPDKAAQGSTEVVAFDGSNSLSLSGLTVGDVASYTIGLRFYQKDHTTDPQILMGQQVSPLARVYSRHTTSNQYYRLNFGSNENLDFDVPDDDGWHSLLLCQEPGTIKLSVDGGAFVSASNASLNMPTFALGNSSDAAGSGLIDVRSLMFIAADVSATPADLANVWQALNTM